MLHIFQAEDSLLPYAEFNSLLHERTLFGSGTEFAYSYSSIYGFMLVLQNLFTGFLAAFSAILTFVAMIVMGHSIVSTIEQDYKDMGILKTVSYTHLALRPQKPLTWLDYRLRRWRCRMKTCAIR